MLTRIVLRLYNVRASIRFNRTYWSTPGGAIRPSGAWVTRFVGDFGNTWYRRHKPRNRPGGPSQLAPLGYDLRSRMTPQIAANSVLEGSSRSSASHGFPRRLCRTGSDGVRVWIRSGSGKIVFLVDTNASVLKGQSYLLPVSKSDPVLPSRPQSSRSSERSRIVAWFQPESVCRSPSL
jgi:hypothetical protein